MEKKVSNRFTDLQVRGFETLVNELGQGSFWEMDLPRGFAKEDRPIFEPGSEEYSRELEAITDLIQQGWEGVLVTNFNWFDEGGPACHIYIANKKARERVWAEIDRVDNTESHWAEVKYLADIQAYPEDYKAYCSGPY
jgi:hypothetical protein